MKQKNNWFEIWFADKQSVIETMIRNMQADLEAGYNPHGASISHQRVEIDAYKAAFASKLEQFANMTEEKVQRYCHYDLLRRGVIA